MFLKYRTAALKQGDFIDVDKGLKGVVVAGAVSGYLVCDL